MYFQASEYKERNFLELNNNTLICPTYIKGEAWLKYFGSSNSLCAYVARLVTDHTPISEYRLRFFSKESIAYLCSNYLIEMRRHILFKCPQYKKSWNLKRELLKDILTFLEFNPRAFCFQNGIIQKRGLFFLILVFFVFFFYFFLFFLSFLFFSP